MEATRNGTTGRAPVLRHDIPDEIRPPSGDSCIPQISAHIERSLGAIENVMHELLSDRVHVDLFLVGPGRGCPDFRVVTSGMSDLPMKTPKGVRGACHAELVMTLPGDWPRDQRTLRRPEALWPMVLLTEMARLPHQCGTWLWAGHTVANEDPPEAYAPGLPFCASLLLEADETPDAFQRLRIRRGKTIQFLSVIPLMAEELAFSRLAGPAALVEKLKGAGIGALVDPERPCCLHR